MAPVLGSRRWAVTLTAGPVVLRAPRMRDGRSWSQIRLRNEQWLAQWEPTSALGWNARNAPTAWPPLLSALRRSARSGSMLPFVVTYGGQLVGQINVSNIVYGVLRSCTVGYWIDSAVAGRNITPTALALVIDHCLLTLGLHRVEVDIRPENVASLRVVEKLHLRQEGYYERYLDIGGAWRDHLAFAVTIEELGGSTMLSRLSGVPRPPG